MKSIIDKVRGFKQAASDFLVQNRKVINIVLKDNLNKELLSRLKRGELVLSEDFIRHHIEEAVEKEKDVTFNDVECTPNGIKIKLNAKRYNARVKVDFTLYIKTAKINSSRQIFIFKLDNEKMVGDNLTGKIISTFTESLLAGMIAKSAFPEEILKSIHFKDDHTAAVVDLSDVELIKGLNKNIGGMNFSTLDLISLDRVKHTYNGVNLKFKVAGFLAKKKKRQIG